MSKLDYLLSVTIGKLLHLLISGPLPVALGLVILFAPAGAYLSLRVITAFVKIRAFKKVWLMVAVAFLIIQLTAVIRMRVRVSP